MHGLYTRRRRLACRRVENGVSASVDAIRALCYFKIKFGIDISIFRQYTVDVIERTIIPRIKRLAETFPAIAIVGARQAGKTTLAKMCFPNHHYVSLEDPEHRAFAVDDPRGFISRYCGGAILDEVQRTPDLFSYLHGAIDANRSPGSWILTGSQNFLVLGSVSQSLAGRVAVVELSPFELRETQNARDDRSWYDAMFRGFYPEVVTSTVLPRDWYASYLVTFVERDLRSVLNVGDLTAFERFIRIAAARASQLLNLNSMAVDCGISQPTAKSWLSVLQASGLVFLLKPHFVNFGKRLVKSPKLYWYDTGLLCHLLRISDPAELPTHPYKGPIAETFSVSECVKVISNTGSLYEPFFWRNSNGREIDILIDRGSKLDALEVKSSETLHRSYFDGLNAYREIANKRCASTSLVYLGSDRYDRSGHHLVPWYALGDHIARILSA